MAYGDVQALWNVSLEVEEGSIVALVGANGAGKTTLLKSICGLIDPVAGRICLHGDDVLHLSTTDRVERGIILVPEGRRLFSNLSVLENLWLGAYTGRARPRFDESLERVCELFPILEERKSQRAGLLSGGEQQMLAISRAPLRSRIRSGIRCPSRDGRSGWPRS